MVKREQYAIAGLLGVVALAVLWHLSRQQSTAAPSAATPANNAGSSIPDYPNAPAPVTLGDVILGGSPLNISYNQMPGGQNSLPTIHIQKPNAVSPLGAPSGACCKECDSAGPSNVVSITQKQIDNGAAQMSGFRFGTLPGARAPLSEGMIVN